MDSGNSGSMQSSSGGDDEYDSRASISVLFNNNNHHVVVGGPISNPPPPPPQHLNNNQQESMLSNYFDPLTGQQQHFTNSNTLLNLDLLNWSKNIRSDTITNNPADLAPFIASSSSPTHQFFTTQPPPPPNRPNSFQIPQVHPSSGSALNDHQTSNNNTTSGSGNVVRNPKKRSRASRRAPTTVLTTDTTNFRAMVQEFTGIPAPPFTSSSSSSSSSPFPMRSRLDLFGNTNSSSSSSFRSAESPSYLLRPFAQKIQPCSTNTTKCSSSSSMVSTTTTNVNSDLGLLNPLLNFNPLFHSSSSTKFPFSNNNMKAHHHLEIPASDPNNLKMGVFEEENFGLGPVNNWVGDDEDDRNGNGLLMRSINNGNYTPSSSASDQNVTKSDQGMMESWICSSD